MRLFFIAGVLLLVVACTQRGGNDMEDRLRQQAIAGATSDFERLCYQNGHMWMPMLPHRDGVPVGNASCYGCMPDGDNHICDVQEYKEHIGQR